MDLLENLEMSFLNFKLVMIYIIHKMQVLLKNQPNYLKDSIFECFFKEYDSLYFQQIIFLTAYNYGKFKL